MPYITDSQFVEYSTSEETITRMKNQIGTFIDALEDVLNTFRSSADAELKLARIEDLLSSAVVDVIAIEDNRENC